MKIGEVRNRSTLELMEDQDKLRKELFDLRFQGATEQIDNPSQIKEIKRTIARILTVLNERKREAKGKDEEERK